MNEGTRVVVQPRPEGKASFFATIVEFIGGTGVVLVETDEELLLEVTLERVAIAHCTCAIDNERLGHAGGCAFARWQE